LRSRSWWSARGQLVDGRNTPSYLFDRTSEQESWSVALSPFSFELARASRCSINNVASSRHTAQLANQKPLGNRSVGGMAEKNSQIDATCVLNDEVLALQKLGSRERTQKACHVRTLTSRIDQDVAEGVLRVLAAVATLTGRSRRAPRRGISVDGEVLSRKVGRTGHRFTRCSFTESKHVKIPKNDT